MEARAVFAVAGQIRNGRAITKKMIDSLVSGELIPVHEQVTSEGETVGHIVRFEKELHNGKPAAVAIMELDDAFLKRVEQK